MLRDLNSLMESTYKQWSLYTLLRRSVPRADTQLPERGKAKTELSPSATVTCTVPVKIYLSKVWHLNSAQKDTWYDKEA